jgi:hypothetical protein
MVKDYLNFYCETCNKNLCKDHYHNPENCPFSDNKKENKQINQFNKKSNKCDFCNKITFNHENYKCKFCAKEFCLAHRLESDHKCSVAQKVGISDKYIVNKNTFKEKLSQLQKNKK